MRGRDDDRHASRDMLQHGGHDEIALVIGQHELLGEIGEDADAVGAGIDHEVDRALLALEIETAVGVEDGRRDREDALVELSG